MSAFHLSIAVTPLVTRTGKGCETGTGYSKPFVQPKRRPRDVSWHLPSGTWRESETPQAHWNWDEHQRQETLLKNDIRMSSPKQTVHSKQVPEPGVASALSDEGDSGNEDDGTQINSDATVRPVTLPQGWTVVLNSLRQVVYCHVKSGIACFQMPENPELLDDLKFENGTSSGSGNLSQKRRSDCKRRLGNRPEHGKSKISRDNHHQRSSQYIENQVMVKSPSYWIDPFQMKPDRRRTTKLTSTAGPMLRDVIELKQVALWHGGKIRIDQACKAAAEGIVRHSICGATLDNIHGLKFRHWRETAAATRLVGVCYKQIFQSRMAPVSVLHWRSRKPTRKAGSPQLVETYAASSAVVEMTWIKALWESMTWRDFDILTQRRSSRPLKTMMPHVIRNENPACYDPEHTCHGFQRFV